MGKDSGIEWTTHTHNLWHGCVKVGQGCKNCYAETWSKRSGEDYWGPTAPRRFFKDAHYRQPLAWNRAAEREGERHRVFCGSMMDPFEQHQDLAMAARMKFRRDELFSNVVPSTMENLDWLFLTKRLENVLKMVPPSWHHSWPRNVWLGFSASTQAELEEGAQKLAHILNNLAQLPPITFVSLEPLIEQVDVSPYLDYNIQKGETGHGERENSLRSGTVGRVANRQPGAGVDEEEEWLEEGRTQTTTGVSSSQEDEKSSEDTHRCAQARLLSLQGRDTGGFDDQSQEWQEERQQTREPGSSDLLGEQEACIQDWSDQSRRPKEPSQQVNEPANRGNTGKVCTGRSDTGRTGKRISRGLPDDLKDSQGGSLPESAWPDGELYPSQGKWQQETEFQGKIQFVIVGGESGKDARPMHPDWARRVRDDCEGAGAFYFLKQWGEWLPTDQYQFADIEIGFNDLSKDRMIAASKVSPGFLRVGKKRAGAILDGREWRQVPEVKHD